MSNVEHGQYSLLSKITSNKWKNFFACHICVVWSGIMQMINSMLLLNIIKYFLMFLMTLGRAFQVCWNIASI